MIVIRINLFLL